MAWVGRRWKAPNRDLQIFTLLHEVYDQAVACTHDKLNGVLKTQLVRTPVPFGEVSFVSEQRLSAFTMDNLVRRRCHKFVSHHAQDVWHCPKTNGTQHILRASCHIVDTNTRPLGVPVGCGQVIGYHWYHPVDIGYPMVFQCLSLSNCYPIVIQWLSNGLPM